MCKKIVYTFISTVCIGCFVFHGYCADAPDSAFNYDSKGKRDPFVPLVGQEKKVAGGLEALETVVSPDDLKLEGIATGAGGKQVAILNGQMVKDDNKFGALLIKKISRKTVEISIEDRNYTLTLEEPEKENAGVKK